MSKNPTDWDKHYRKGTLRQNGIDNDHQVTVNITDREIVVVAAMFIVSVLIAAGSLYWLLA